jgi:hypothetical protein
VMAITAAEAVQGLRLPAPLGEGKDGQAPSVKREAEEEWGR